MVSPPVRRAAVKRLESEREYSERRACNLVKISRTAARYEFRTKPDEEELRKRIKELSRKKQRYGARRIHALLVREGMNVNHKRVHRIWKDEGLSLPRRRPRRRRAGPRIEVVNKAVRKDHVWSYDFVEDRTSGGGRLRCLTIVDEYTRECLALPVRPSAGARKVIETLEWLFLFRGVPEYLRSDNGPEFVAHAVQDWLKEKGVKTLFITPGSPWENPYIESFNGKFRDECLNREIFQSCKEARIMIESWRVEYNERRPHSSLGYMTPSEFAERVASSGRATSSLRSPRAKVLVPTL